jgi:copper chaperone CopZ
MPWRYIPMFGFGKKITVVINVNGMHCPKCAEKVKKAVLAVKLVKDAVVDLDGKTVTVTALERVDVKAVKAAIAAAGFEVAE